MTEKKNSFWPQKEIHVYIGDMYVFKCRLFIYVSYKLTVQHNQVEKSKTKLTELIKAAEQGGVKPLSSPLSPCTLHAWPGQNS